MASLSPADARAARLGIAGRVHFAGEATHVEHYGTVHGAYLSGLAAAQRIAVQVAT